MVSRREGLTLLLILGVIMAFGFQNCAEVKLAPKPEPAPSIAIKVESYCPSPSFKLSEVFAVNLSATLDNDNVIADTDRDGLSDMFENSEPSMLAYNISATTKDTSMDGYSDLVIVSLGFDLNTQGTLSYCADPNQDSDRDLLDDCAEDLIGTDLNNPDTDNDGIPDGLEFRYSLNPRDGEDSKTDIDQDGLNSLYEVKVSTPLRNTNSEKASLQATQYKVDHYIDENTNRDCYSLDIQNISVSNVNNGNYIRLIFLEKTLVEEQGEVAKIRDVSVIVSRRIINSAVINIDQVNNQTETFGFE